MTRGEEALLDIWEHSEGVIEVLTSNPMGAWLHRRDKRVITDILNKLRTEVLAMMPPLGEWMYGEGHEKEQTACEVIADVLQIIDKYRKEHTNGEQ